MIISYCESIHHKQAANFEISVAKLVEKPFSAAAKDGVSLFNAAIRTEKVTKRSQEEVICYTALILDYDDSIGFEAALALLPLGTTYALYTSFRHTPEAPKFRVVIPVAKIIPAGIYHEAYFKKAVAEYFQCDPSTASPDRFFYMPNRGGAHYAHSLSLGKPLDLFEFEPFVDIYAKHYQAEEAKAQAGELRKAQAPAKPVGPVRKVPDLHIAGKWYWSEGEGGGIPVKYFKERLDSLAWNQRGTGGTHNELCTIVACMKNFDLTQHDAWDILSEYESSGNYNEVRGVFEFIYK